MDAFAGLNMGLGSLPLITNARTRSVSAENLRAKRAEADGGAGSGWSGVQHLESGAGFGAGLEGAAFHLDQTRRDGHADGVVGPGLIQHIWMTTMREWGGSGRGCVLRFYWDGEDSPSVEVPLTDFFAVGHDLFAR